MRALESQIADTRRIHWMAWSLIACGYIMSALLAWMKKDWLAGIILTTTIIGTLAGFLQNRRNDAKPKNDNGQTV